jgi:transcriptional regulator
MYTPEIYKQENKTEIENFIRQNSFGILVSQTNGKLWGTHIPLELSEGGDKLYSHISRANPQWKNIHDLKEVLAIFSGPHAYISSSWYDHENVPTWNYIAVHVYGTVKIIEGKELRATLKRLVDKYERHSTNPVSVEKMSEGYVDKQMKGIVGLEITITSIEATNKLSQNRDRKNFHAVIDELEKKNDPHAQQVADEMKKVAHSLPHLKPES